MANLGKNATSWIVYSINDPRDGIPFYIGLTSNLRKRKHQHGTDGALPTWRRVREIIADGKRPIFVVLAEHVDQNTALEHEHELILTMPGLVNRRSTHRHSTWFRREGKFDPAAYSREWYRRRREAKA